MKHEKSYGIIPLKGESVFIVRHKAGDYWGFPKGHQEEGETPLTTALRELKEETGLEADQVDETHPFIEAYAFRRGKDDIKKTVVYYVAHVVGEAVHLAEDVTEGKWVPLAQASEALTFDGNKQIANEVSERYG